MLTCCFAFSNVMVSLNVNYKWIYFEGNRCCASSLSVVLLMVILSCTGRIWEVEAVNDRDTTLSQTGKLNTFFLFKNQHFQNL